MNSINKFLVSLIYVLTSIACMGQSEKELESKRIKIITDSNQTLVTTNAILGDSVLTFNTDHGLDSLSYKNIVYIYIKEGSNIPKMMIYCVSFGLAYGVIWGLISPSYTFIGNAAIGLTSGIIAGLIIIPFTRKPEKLIYYKGKWTDRKYEP